MSFMEGLKNVEIAEKLGLSDSSVKKYKARALDFLRKKLEPSLFLFFIFRVIEIILKKLQFSIAPFEGCCVIGEI